MSDEQSSYSECWGGKGILAGLTKNFYEECVEILRTSHYVVLLIFSSLKI